MYSTRENNEVCFQSATERRTMDRRTSAQNPNPTDLVEKTHSHQKRQMSTVEISSLFQECVVTALRST